MIRGLAMAACVLAGVFTSAKADVIYSSLTGVTEGASVTGGSWRHASSFTTDACDYTLNSLTLAMYSGDTGVGHISVSLYGNTAENTPGASPLLTLAGATPAASANYTYIGTQALAPNTTYWVVVAETIGVGTYRESLSQNSPSVGSGLGIAYSADSGATWGTDNSLAFRMEVDATPIPEPATMSLLALGGLALLKRRKK